MTNKTLFGALAVGLMLSVGVGCGSPATPATPSTPTTPDPAAAAADADGDGVPDNVDKCLDKKEDGLGPQPKDGCPNPKP